MGRTDRFDLNLEEDAGFTRTFAYYYVYGLALNYASGYSCSSTDNKNNNAERRPPAVNLRGVCRHRTQKRCILLNIRPSWPPPSAQHTVQPTRHARHRERPLDDGDAASDDLLSYRNRGLDNDDDALKFAAFFYKGRHAHLLINIITTASSATSKG